MKNKFVIVGGLPEPIGGVTNFLYRLVASNGESVAAVIDMYDNRHKVILENFTGNYHIIPKGFLKLFVLSVLLFKYRGYPIFFNFSRSYAFAPLTFLPKFKSSRWMLMLHHGDLCISNKLINCFLKGLIFCSRNKIDKVLALSESQQKYYVRNNFNCVIKTTSYIPCTTPHVFDYIKYVVSDLHSRGKQIIIASGFPRKIYNHSWVVDFVNNNKNIALFLFLYGDGECMHTLSESCSRVESCYLFYGCSESVFNYALSLADIYVRPNDVDSFGIACADAITLGTNVLASDVCDRFSGCLTYQHSKGSTEFAAKLSEIIFSGYMLPKAMRSDPSYFSITLLK